MKSFLIFIVCTMVVLNTATAQCSSSARIQSPVAPRPIAASATVSCTNMLIHWQGASNQGYELNVTVKDGAGKTISSGINTSYKISSADNYTAAIAVTPGTKVSWILQGISTVDDRTFYSYPLRGKEYIIPACTAPLVSSNAAVKSLQVISDKKIGAKIYPNPVQSILHVQFNNTGTTQKIISLFNAGGQSVLMKQTSESYMQIDVKGLASGTYFIRISDANGTLLFNGKVIKE